MNNFLEYRFEAEMLCIGERIKKGTFRPCLTTIPCSTISEALNTHLGQEDSFALGFLDNNYIKGLNKKKRGIMTTAPKDTVLLVSKLPLVTEYLIEARGKVFIEERDGLKEDLEKYPEFQMGALKSKGLGNCHIKFERDLEKKDIELIEGKLKTRIYEDTQTLARLGIEDVIKPLYGYLYKRTSFVSGYYQRSLFEGSIIKGPKFIIEEVER